MNALKDKIEGPVRSADETLVFMNMNKNFSGTYTFPAPPNIRLDTKNFNDSVYIGPIRKDREWREVKMRTGRSLASMPSVSAKVLLMEHLVHAHFHYPKTINDLVGSFRTKKALGDMQYPQIEELKKLALNIMNKE